MGSLSRIRTLVAHLRKFAGACPLCGDLQAENGPKTTQCTNKVCQNYSIERAFQVSHGVEFSPLPPPNTSEHNRPPSDFDDIHISYSVENAKNLNIEEPVRSELRSLLRSPDVYVIKIPAPFSHEMIPSQFKRKVSGFFTEVSINGGSVYITDDNKNTYYANALFQMYLLADSLSEIFSGVGKYLTTGALKVAYGEINRIVVAKDAEQALRVATRYQEDLSPAILRKLEAVVLENGTPSMAYFFAKDVKGADIKRLEQKVLDSADLQTIYVFAKNIEGADIPAAEKHIIQSRNANYLRLFIQNVDVADTTALELALASLLKKRTDSKSEA